MLYRAIVRLTAHIKIRSFAKSIGDAWRHEWRNPLSVDLPITNPNNFLQTLWELPTSDGEVFYVDKLDSGFLTWAPTIKVYRRVAEGSSALVWEQASQPLLEAMRAVMSQDDFFVQLTALFAQESSKNPTTLKVRPEHVLFVKSIGWSIFLPDPHLVLNKLTRSKDIRERATTSHAFRHRTSVNGLRPL